MFNKLLIPVTLLCVLFLVQCADEPIFPETIDQETQANETVQLKRNGNGNHDENGQNGGTGGLYGDLIICLRTPNGIPIYDEIDGEHGVAYYPVPILYNEVTLEPLILDDTYQTFDLNLEGEPILEDGYIIKEADFGRLNLIRSPQSVLDQALQEAINGLTQEGVTQITTDASGRLIAIIGAEDWLVNYDDNPLNDEFNDKTIDSPRENMAIYQEIMSNNLNDQLSFLSDYGFDESDIYPLAYSAMAAGGDKTGTIIIDELAYMNNWFLKWDSPDIIELPESPDVKDRRYYDFRDFSYSREEVYGNKFVRITRLSPNGSWTNTFHSIQEVAPWTKPSLLIGYENGNNVNVTGFSNAADDAVQVLEFIHESDLIVYSPYFTASGFNP